MVDTIASDVQPVNRFSLAQLMLCCWRADGALTVLLCWLMTSDIIVSCIPRQTLRVGGGCSHLERAYLVPYLSSCIVFERACFHAIVARCYVSKYKGRNKTCNRPQMPCYVYSTGLHQKISNTSRPPVNRCAEYRANYQYINALWTQSFWTRTIAHRAKPS